jgi:hypothetical protein
MLIDADEDFAEQPAAPLADVMLALLDCGADIRRKVILAVRTRAVADPPSPART